MRRVIYMALPAYHGTIRVETSAGIVNAAIDCAAKGWDLRYRLSIGDCILPRVRNRFIADALADPAVTDLFFIDHDIAWEDGAIIRMLEHPVDFVAGVYPKREDPITYPVRYLKDQPTMTDPATGLVEVEGVPGGFMRIRTSALRRMVEHYAHLEYEEEALASKNAWALFDYDLNGKRYWGEDFVFCNRWREMGGKIWVDPLLSFHHIGPKPFRGCLFEHLQEIEKQQAAA
jgi:hypothetical protein